jgi:hypothetical protein
MKLQSNRRAFLKGAAAAPVFIRELISKPRNSTLRLGAFGGGNMAYITLDIIAAHPSVKLACLAEVDSAQLGNFKKKYADTPVHQDWRRMLDAEYKNLDIVCVATPDHMHAPIAMSAMQRGLHVYCQKPLAHDLYECRRLAATAHKKNLVSQMGIQVHSSKEYKTAVQLVQSGAIGKVKEVHSWSNKKWGDPDPMPDRSDPVPATLNWDLWLGTAAVRPFLGDKYFHPVNWRKRVDFGTATFGDMGCHIYDPVFSALRLTSPLSVRSEGPKPTQHNWAIDAVIHYVFPGTAITEGKTVNVTWYDGDALPPREIQALTGERKLPEQGSIFVGTAGVMLLPHVGMPALLPEQQFKDHPIPAFEKDNHYHQFVDTVLGKGKTSAPFDYAGPLTEAVLLGPVATRFPQTTLEWNAAKMKFKNSPEASAFVRRTYRKGWEVKGL